MRHDHTSMDRTVHPLNRGFRATAWIPRSRHGLHRMWGTCAAPVARRPRNVRFGLRCRQPRDLPLTFSFSASYDAVQGSARAAATAARATASELIRDWAAAPARGV